MEEGFKGSQDEDAVFSIRNAATFYLSVSLSVHFTADMAENTRTSLSSVTPVCISGPKKRSSLCIFSSTTARITID